MALLYQRNRVNFKILWAIGVQGDCRSASGQKSGDIRNIDCVIGVKKRVDSGDRGVPVQPSFPASQKSMKRHLVFFRARLTTQAACGWYLRMKLFREGPTSREREAKGVCEWLFPDKATSVFFVSHLMAATK